MKKILSQILAALVASQLWAAQHPLTEISIKQSNKGLREAINAQVVAPAQDNFTQIWEALNGSPWLAQTTAPSIHNVFWIDTSGASPTVKYWDGDSWEVTATGGSGISHATSDGVYYASKDGAWSSLDGVFVNRSTENEWTAVQNFATGFTASGISITLGALSDVKFGSGNWVDDTKTSGDLNYLWSSKMVFDQLALKSDTTHNHTGMYEPADSNIIKVSEIDSLAEFTALLGWSPGSGGSGGYVATPPTHSNDTCTVGQYAFSTSPSVYHCKATNTWDYQIVSGTGLVWAGWNNPTPSTTALVLWDGGDTVESQSILNVYQEGLGAITTTGADFSVLGIGGTGHSAEVLDGDTINFQCTDGTSIDLDQGQIDIWYSRSTTPEAYGTFFQLGSGASDFVLRFYSTVGDNIQFRYGGNRYDWPAGAYPFIVGTFYKITLVWDRAGADPILKINDVAVSGGAWTTGSGYPTKPTIVSPVMYVCTDDAGLYQPLGRCDDLAIYPVAQ